MYCPMPNLSDYPETAVLLGFRAYFPSTLDIKQTVSTWLDCPRLMSTLRRIEPFVRGNISMAFFDLKIAIFSTALVCGNRSMWLSLLIIYKCTDLPTASRLRSDGTSPKSHRLDFRMLPNPFSGLKIHEFFQLDIGMVIIAILTSKCLRIMFE